MIIVTVKCLGCQNVLDIKNGGWADLKREFSMNDQPICDKCGMPMVPIKVARKND